MHRNLRIQSEILFIKLQAPFNNKETFNVDVVIFISLNDETSLSEYLLMSILMFHLK